jgi:uncharacterized protein YnzC (UPF0291/DUF896 family)
VEFLKMSIILSFSLTLFQVILYRKLNKETQLTEPGMVDKVALRHKLAKQWKIDLEKHETLHLREEIVEQEDSTPEKLLEIVESMDVSQPCKVQIRRLGHYVARISLSGGYAIPLKFQVVESS